MLLICSRQTARQEGPGAAEVTGMDLTPCSGLSDNPCNEAEKNCSKTHAGTRDGSDLTGIQEVNPTFPYSQVNR